MRGDGASTGAMGAGLSELDAFFSPGKRQQIENLQTLEMLADDDASSAAPPRAVDLGGNSAVIRVRRDQAETGSTPEETPASSRE